MTGSSRLKIGKDVPWVTGWSAEAILGARPCASVDGRLAIFQSEQPGQGRPIYSMNHCRRQRESVVRMLCPMCGQPTMDGDRWTLTARRTTARALRAQDLGYHLPAVIPDVQVVVDAGSIAPLHQSCATEAWARCPHLGALQDIELKPFPKRWIATPLLVNAEPPGASVLLAQSPEPEPAIAFLQIVGITDEVERKTGRDAWRRSAPRRA